MGTTKTEGPLNRGIRIVFLLATVLISLAAYRLFFFFFSSRRRHTRCSRDWSSDVCSSDLLPARTPVQTKARSKRFVIGAEETAGDTFVSGNDESSRGRPGICAVRCYPRTVDRKSVV